MKLCIFCAALFTIATLGDCKPAVDSHSAATSTKSDVRKPQAIGPAPIVISNPVNETNFLFEGDVGFNSQEVSEKLSRIEEIVFNAAANTVAACGAEAKKQCDAFIKTDGIICRNSGGGVHCDTRNKELCSDDAVELCYDFTDNKGLYCSNGSCSVLKQV